MMMKSFRRKILNEKKRLTLEFSFLNFIMMLSLSQINIKENNLPSEKAGQD